VAIHVNRNDPTTMCLSSEKLNLL